MNSNTVATGRAAGAECTVPKPGAGRPSLLPACSTIQACSAALLARAAVRSALTCSCRRSSAACPQFTLSELSKFVINNNCCYFMSNFKFLFLTNWFPQNRLNHSVSVGQMNSKNVSQNEFKEHFPNECKEWHIQCTFLR
jgi:hypothetical protein